MIHTNRIVTVGEQECIIDRPIVLYRGDREVEIEFTLVGNEFMFSEEGNVIKSVNASHGQLVLNTPSGEHMFSELAECHEGKVVFVVTKEMIDEFIEMGFYSFQIRLYDSAEMKSRVTIPPVMNGFDIRNPIAAEDETNVVDQGIVDYARIFKDQSNEELPTFTWDGEYVKTEWAHHDLITENKMNKIEDALYSINANIKESDVVMLNALDNVKKDADKYVKEHMAEVEADVEDFERNLNTGVEKFKVDTNAAMTAHKNEVSEELEGFSTQLAHNTSDIQTMFVYSNSDFQGIIDYCITNNIKQINVNEDIELSSGVNFKEFEGYVFGKGKIKAKPGVKISPLVNLSNSKNIKFEVNIDMGQNELTELNNDKCDIGIYMRNARNITLDNVTYTNCRIGRPLYISGSSSCNPTISDGSKNITINNNKIFGIEYPVVDEGCYIVVSSDFYTESNGIYYGASNGTKISDLTVDESVAYKPTTQNIFINNLYAENCDRIAILNVDKIFFNDCILENFYTRGYNFSPTCTNFSVKGGYVNGGNATQLAVAYGCENGSFENIKVTPNEIIVGEKSTLKTYYGCNNISYTNISGIGNYDRSIYVKSASDITFDNVKLNRNNITVKYGIEIICCDNDNTYTMKNIKFKNCMIEANAGLYIESVKTNGKINVGGITFEDCDFDCNGEFIRTLSNMGALGFLVLKNLDVKYSTSANQIIDSKNVLYYDKSNRGIVMNMSKQITTTTTTILHYFDGLYYFVPKTSVSAGEDYIRPVNVSLYRDGALLVYGVDWFCSGSMANEQIINYIRLKDGSSVAIGSKLTLVRHN